MWRSSNWNLFSLLFIVNYSVVLWCQETYVILSSWETRSFYGTLEMVLCGFLGGFLLSNCVYLLIIRFDSQYMHPHMWNNHDYPSFGYSDPDLLFTMEKISGSTLMGPLSGQVSGGAQIVPGKLGLALNFDGIDGMVNFGYNPESCLHDLEMCSEGLTIAFWIKIHNVHNKNRGVILHSVAYIGETGLQIRLYPEFFRFRINARYQKWTYQMPLLPLFKWHFVTMSFFVDTLAVYVNGCSAAMFSRVDTATHREHLLTGNLRMGCEPSWNPMACSKISVDQMMVWYKQLPAEAVWQVYLQGGQI